MALSNDGWKNKLGTSKRGVCGCGTWKNHWINNSGKTWPTFCSAQGCFSVATDGSHVYNSSISQKEYIVPLCHKCNERNDEFSLKGEITLVPVNQKMTCDK